MHNHPAVGPVVAKSIGGTKQRGTEGAVQGSHLRMGQADGPCLFAFRYSSRSRVTESRAFLCMRRPWLASCVHKCMMLWETSVHVLFCQAVCSSRPRLSGIITLYCLVIRIGLFYQNQSSLTVTLCSSSSHLLLYGMSSLPLLPPLVNISSCLCSKTWRLMALVRESHTFLRLRSEQIGFEGEVHKETRCDRPVIDDRSVEMGMGLLEAN